MTRRADRNRPALDTNLAGIGAHGAEDQLARLGPPGSEQTGEPDHFAGAQLQIEIPHIAPPAQTLDGQDRLAVGHGHAGRPPRFCALQFAAEHQRDQLEARQLRGRRRADQTAVSQHGDAVGDLVDLIDEVGDEDDGDAARLEIAQDAEQQFDLARIEARGRFVEHEDPRVVLQRPGDRHELLDGDGIRGERPFDVDVEVQALEPFARALVRLPP